MKPYEVLGTEPLIPPIAAVNFLGELRLDELPVACIYFFLAYFLEST